MGYRGVVVSTAGLRSIEWDPPPADLASCLDRSLGCDVGSSLHEGTETRGSLVLVGGGVRGDVLARMAARRGWSGLEWAGGIPGSVGAGCRHNAGAHGGRWSDIVVAAEVVVVPKTGAPTTPRLAWVARDAIAWGDRAATWPGAGNDAIAVVTAALLRLTSEASPGRAAAATAEHLAWRRERQPLGRPSAGCVFRNNPKCDGTEFGETAGALLDRLGMRGVGRGGAVVSSEHANWIVTSGAGDGEGTATAADVRDLIEECEAAADRVGATLVREVVVVPPEPAWE